jgi:hypothetical protein
VDRPYGTKSRKLFQLWTRHDLADHRPEFGSYRRAFYEGLRPEDEPAVWGFIEENYLRKYGGFIKVEHEWFAEALWGIPFPGSVSLGEYLSPRGFGMPEELTERIQTWQAAMDRLEPGEEDPDHETSSAERLKIAREVKPFLGDGYYVEFRPFREIVVRDGEAVELEVPAFITNLTR